MKAPVKLSNLLVQEDATGKDVVALALGRSIVSSQSSTSHRVSIVCPSSETPTYLPVKLHATVIFYQSKLDFAGPSQIGLLATIGSLPTWILMFFIIFLTLVSFGPYHVISLISPSLLALPRSSLHQGFRIYEV